MRIRFVFTAALPFGLLLSACSTATPPTSVIQQTAIVNNTATVSPNFVVRSSTLLKGEFVPIDAWAFTLVTARAVPKLGDVREISESFTFEGRIFAHATLTSMPNSNAGELLIEAKWFSGDRLVSLQKTQISVDRSPFYIASSTSGSALGTGPAQVQIFANGKLMATKVFQVTEK